MLFCLLFQRVLMRPGSVNNSLMRLCVVFWAYVCLKSKNSIPELKIWQLGVTHARVRAGVLTSFVERLSPDKNLNVVCDLTLYYILIFGLVYYLRCFSFFNVWARGMVCVSCSWLWPLYVEVRNPFLGSKPVVSYAVCLCGCIRLSCDIACAANIWLEMVKI